MVLLQRNTHGTERPAPVALGQPFCTVVTHWSPSAIRECVMLCVGISLAHWGGLATEEAGGSCVVSCAVPGWWRAQAGAGLGSRMSAWTRLLG